MIKLPDHCVDSKTHRLLLTKIQFAPELEAWIMPHVEAKSAISISDLIGILLPHTVQFSTMWRTPEEWLCEHVQGAWIHWLDEVRFNHPDDAFAFRMRWS